MLLTFRIYSYHFIMKKILVFVLINYFLLSSGQAKSTSYGQEFVYNVSIGAVTGAIGAILNKKKEQNFNKVFFKGLYQGALGGYITFESKRLVAVAEQNDDWKILWAAKLVNAAGVSIKENAALNKNFWENWHINIGFNRLEFETKDEFRVHYKIMPVTLAYTIAYSNRSKFDLGQSLRSGELIFYTNKSNNLTSVNTLGMTFPGGILFHESYNNDFQVLSHEIIHVYQYNDFSQLEAFLNNVVQYTEKNKLMKTINKYIHYDIRYTVFGIFNGMEHNKAKYYYDNIFEKEAGYYSKTFDLYLLK